jgi:hypothetical protein
MNSQESIIDISAESELAATLLRIRSGIQTESSRNVKTDADPLHQVRGSITPHQSLLWSTSKASVPFQALPFGPSQGDRNIPPNFSLPPPIVCEAMSSPNVISFPSSAQESHHSSGNVRVSELSNPIDVEEREFDANNSDDSYDEDNGDYNVRRDIIEAALLSQPQRGRKRDNLSVVERLELTRTRNREHAKSTRIRKKLRHQELVDKEIQLRSVMKREELNKRQCERVLEYVKLRQASLQSEFMSGAIQPECASKGRFQTVVESLISNDFRFESNESIMSDNTVASSIASMNRFGGIVVDIVRNRVGSASQLALLSSTGVSLTEEDVAISRNGVFMVQLCIAALNENLMIKVATLWMRLEFESNTNKIKVIVENISNDTKRNEIRGANLETQTSHPSVVSLDPSQIEEQVVNVSCCNEKSTGGVVDK